MTQMTNLIDQSIFIILMNQLFQLKQIAPNNRGLFAKKSLKIGTKIIQSQPLAWATLKDLKGQICNWCLLKRQLFRCSQCKSFYYCSQECQKKDWSIHKHECKFYQQMVNNKKLSVHKEIASEFVLNLRMAVLIRKQSNIKKMFFDHVSLEDHQSPQKLQYFQEMAVVLLQNMDQEKNEANISQMMRQLNIVSVNAFTIQDFLCETDGVAIGFFSPGSYINHDCQPNSTQYFDGRYLTIVANKEIDQKEEITISYTNPLALIQERRAFLRKNYLFQCFCQTCQVEHLVDTRYHYVLCPDCQKGFEKAEQEDKSICYQCQSCSKILTLNEMSKLNENILKQKGIFEKQSNFIELKKKFFTIRKLLSLDHPFYADAIDKVYHATINHLSSVVEDQDKHNKLLEEAYILLKEEIKGIPKWYRLEEGEEKSIRFFIKYAQMGKLCYNLYKYQKAFEYTELAMNLVKDFHIKNTYPQVDELKIRFEELKIQMSMAKAKSFNSS